MRERKVAEKDKERERNRERKGDGEKESKKKGWLTVFPVEKFQFSRLD